MEAEGIRLDVDFLKEMSKEIDVEIKSLEQKIFETAGETFNWPIIWAIDCNRFSTFVEFILGAFFDSRLDLGNE